MKLTPPGASYLPARQVKGSSHDRHDGAPGPHSWSRQRGRSGAQWGIVGAAPHPSDFLARTDSPRGGSRGCQGLCAEHHAVHRPGSPPRRRRHEIAASPDRTRLRVTGAERHPHRRFRRFDGPYIGAGPLPTSSEIVRLTREGDVQGDVVCQPGSSKGALADRASRRCSWPLHGAASGGRNLREIPHLASEGDVQGDVARSSSSSEDEP